MNVLITGAQGQLGRDLALVCRQRGDIVHALDRNGLDVSQRSAIDEAVNALRPDTIVNCAAWTAVDACEGDPARADRVNHLAVQYLREAADRTGAHLVQVSTDYVFDGTKLGAYVETDQPNPQSVYGTTKHAGEVAAGPTASVVRTSWVCSAHPGNMVATIVRLANEHPELRFVNDQRGNPTFTVDLADALRNLAVDRASGVYHVTNTGTVSWFEFAQAVMTAAGFDPARVSPITTAEMPRPAARPANSALANERYVAEGYQPLRPYESALADIINAHLA